jgi:predicted RNase H-like nuclease (RuvC/YqgF family)
MDINEPVAWTSQDVLDADHIIKAVVRREQDEQHTIPLYTHPSDRIAELEKQIENLKWDVNHREQDIDNLKTRLFDAKRKYDTSTHEYKYSAKYVKELEAKIAELAQSNPLYTPPAKTLDEQFKKGFEAGKEEGWKAHKFHHPAKTLTDEEIEELAREMGMHLNDYEIDPLGNSLDFARVILRKAQEK